MSENTFKQLRSSLLSYSENERGRMFEEYCKQFLINDPRYAAQIKQVWLWKEWPDNWGRDKGIDLIAETITGDIWAIQTKFYGENNYITKEDVDTFLSETARKVISYRLLIASTDNIGPNALEVIQAQEKPIGLCLLNHLEKSTINWFDLNNNDLIAKQVFTPFPHQESAIQSVLKGFKESSYGQLHMACGTGKTLVGLWIAETLVSNKTLVMVPSISLVSQIYDEWVKHKSKDFNFYPIFVCSDETVAKKDQEDNDIYSDQLANLGFPVTTNAKELLSRINSTSNKVVVFSTYHSSPVIKEACDLDNTLKFDLAIADEAHRCAGKVNSYFATIVDPNAIRISKKLFMTATPKFFSERVKKVSKELNCEIISMDEDSHFGPVFYTLPFSEAIKQNLLTDYQVVISIMDNQAYLEYTEKGRIVTINNLETDARTLATQILIAKALKKYGLKRVISFHNRKSNAIKFIDTFVNANELLPSNDRADVKFLSTIFGEMPQSQREVVLKQFKEVTEDNPGLLANVKCLSEGVNIPTLDAVAFIDPKGSEIDIIQSVGRAIRKSPDKTIGTIIIPVYVDNVLNEDNALDNSCFKVIWKVIKALRAHDDILAEELDNYRLELGKQTLSKPPKLSKIHIDIPTILNNDFVDNIRIEVIKSASVIMWRSFELAKEFVKTLKLKSETEWRLYISNQMPHLPALPCDMPRAPWVTYENTGWQSWGDFLGTDIIAPRLKKYRSYEEACIFVHNLKLRKKEDWPLYCKGVFPELPSLPSDIPRTPDKTYRREDYGKKWQGWGDFLGTGRIANIQWVSYEEAELFAQSLNLKSYEEWKKYVKGEYLHSPIFPTNMPKKPDQVYKEWISWPRFLGNGISKFNSRRQFMTFEQAKAFVHNLKLKCQREWHDYCAGKMPWLEQKPLEIPSNPSKKYKNLGWIDWKDWLGEDN